MASVSVCLSECERGAIEELMAGTRNIVEARRCRIMLLLAAGDTVKQVELKVGCVRSTVYTTLYRYEESGVDGLCDGRCAGNARKATPQVREKLLEYIEQPPRQHGWQRPTWTRELLALQLATDLAVSISAGHVGRLLRQEKVRRGKPRPALRIPVKGRANRIRQIEAVVARASPDEEVFYVDEADIDLNPRIGPMYLKRGTQALVLTPGQNVKYYIAGALNYRTGSVHYTHGTRKNSDLFISLLGTLAKSHRRPKKLHLILDNYIIHKSRRTLEALATYHGKIELHFLPPYSPEHNVIERLWKQLHDNVTRNHRHPTMQALWGDVTQFLKAVQPFPGKKVSTLKIAA